MTKYDPPWTLTVDGNGVYVHDADRNLIRAIENDEGEEQISLWSRIVDAVNAQAAHADLATAADQVLAGLHRRIDSAKASGAPVPVFDGIAELHAALARYLGAAR